MILRTFCGHVVLFPVLSALIPLSASTPEGVRLPIVFEPNLGQAGPDTLFVARSPGMVSKIRATGAQLSIQDGTAIEMKLVGARPEAPRGEQPLGGSSNYLVGPLRVTGVPHYGQVRQNGVYPGVDLVYHSRIEQLEFDFRVAAGADPGRIRLTYMGAARIRNDGGDLVLEAGGRQLRQRKPIAYQIIGLQRKEVAAEYLLTGNRVRFQIGSYDPRYELVIDPVLSYATFLGGSLGDAANGVAVDSSGNTYVIGETSSLNLTPTSAYQAAHGGGNRDAFVAKLNSSGDTLVYLTYLGGSGDDLGKGIAVDGSGNAYLTGQTNSSNFPLQGAIKGTLGTGGKRAFITKLSAAGNSLVYSTYFGNNGSTDDWGNAIAVDSTGAAYVTGATNGGLTAVSAAQAVYGLGTDAFVTKVNPAGSAFAFTTYLGGGGSDEGFGIAVDTAGQAVVTGATSSSNFPTFSAKQATAPYFNNAFVTKYIASGSGYVFSTYLGGTSSSSEGRAVAVDTLSNAYVTGTTYANNFPVQNAAQAATGGFSDAFVTAFSPNGSAYLHSTYLGGAKYERGLAISSDSAGNVVVGGQTDSGNFPQVSAIQGRGSSASSVIKSIDSAGAWVPTTPVSDVYNLAVDPSDASVIYAVTPGAIQGSLNGGATWSSIATPGIWATFNSIAVDPSDPCKVYAGLDGYWDKFQGTIYGPTSMLRTTCNGSWSNGPQPVETYRKLMTAAPTNPTTLYWLGGYVSGGLALPSLCRGPDLATFACAGTLLATSFAIDPANPCTAYFGGASGVVSKNTSCSAFNLTSLPALPSTVSALAAHPTDGQTILAGLATGEVYRKVGAGNWTLMALLDGSVSALTFQPGNGSILYAGTGGGSKGGYFYAPVGGGSIYKSVNGGTSFTRTSFLGGAVTQISISPATTATLYASNNSHEDGFVTSYSAAGAVTFSTYHGGVHADSVNALALSSAGDIHVAGTTQSYNYPVTAAAPQPSYGGISDAFVAKFSPGVLTTVDTNPTGLSVIVDSVPVTAPHTYVWTPGGTHTIAVSSPQPSAASRLVFASWSDAGAQSHSIIAPTSAATFTATFNREFPLTTTASPATGGTVTANPASVDGYYGSGASVQLSAAPAAGYGFVNWNGDLAGTATPQSVIMSVARTVTANFALLPVLTIASTHTGSFSQGQRNAAYQITVANQPAAGPSSGTVTVSVSVPAGLTLKSMAGTGWTCPAGGSACTRSDALAAGDFYPPITASVDVASNAASPLVLAASVSGGGSVTGNATDSTVIQTAFNDIAAADYYFDAVNLMRQYGITGGCGVAPPAYCPGDNVTRAQMAIFIVRAVMGGDTFSYNSIPQFWDVPANAFGFKWIQKMYELGITAGCGAGNYCPNDPVTRGQMAIFVIRARLGAPADSTFTYPSAPYFSDAPATHPYYKWIQRMRLDGITGGCGSGSTYCPDDSVTRGQMAIFIMRGALNQLLAAGTPVLLNAAPTVASLGQTITVILTGSNTNFQQGVTQVNAGPGITTGTITVSNATTLSVQLTIAGNATVGPRTLVASTASEQAVLPNGLTVQ